MLTVDEYLAFEERSCVRHEFVAGTLIAQAGTSERHNRIALNIANRLMAVTDDGPCRVLMSDVKLRVADEFVYYPDIMVICDPEDAHPYIKTRPCLLVEVLSPSTEGIDRREKLLAYRRIATLKTYVIVHQDEPRVVRNFSDAKGAWWQEDLVNNGHVLLTCPQTELQFPHIYRGIDFSSE
jgi:Uma2 family endonuclease